MSGDEGTIEAMAEGGTESSLTNREETRERLLLQFTQWLDRTLDGETAPEGVPAELIEEVATIASSSSGVEADLYSVFSSLTALSGEIRLQGRAFKQLTDTLTPLADVPSRIEQLRIAQAEAAKTVQDFVDEQRESEGGSGALPPAKEVLSVVFDLYDRMQRGLRVFEETSEAKTNAGGWRQRLFGGWHRTRDNGLAEGYRLTLSRIEGAFAQWGIERIGAVGDAFDPTIMTAIDVEDSEDAEDGSVLEVYRGGYMIQGELLGTAQVKVARSLGAR